MNHDQKTCKFAQVFLRTCTSTDVNQYENAFVILRQ